VGAMHCGNGYRYTGRIKAFVLITPVYYCLADIAI